MSLQTADMANQENLYGRFIIPEEHCPKKLVCLTIFVGYRDGAAIEGEKIGQSYAHLVGLTI